MLNHERKQLWGADGQLEGSQAICSHLLIEEHIFGVLLHEAADALGLVAVVLPIQPLDAPCYVADVGRLDVPVPWVQCSLGLHALLC